MYYVMKVAIKVIENRLKHILGDIIDASQSTFVLDHLITDSALVDFELFHYMKTCG